MVVFIVLYKKVSGNEPPRKIDTRGMGASKPSLMLGFVLGSPRGRFKAVGAEDTMYETTNICRGAVYVSESLKVLLIDIGIGCLNFAI